MDYLIQYEPNAFLTLDIMPTTCYLHYFDPKKTDNEVINLADKLGTLRRVGTDIIYYRDEKLQTLTFTIYWDIDDL